MQIVSREEMQAIDRHAIESIGLGGHLLMENAGRGIFEHLRSILGQDERIGVIIGKGNNGGDGFVIARYLRDHGYSTDVWVIGEAAAIIGDSAYHKAAFERSGGSVSYATEEAALNDFEKAMRQWDVMIDALLGTGIKGAPRPFYLRIIQCMNKSQVPVYSVDMPSGVPANGGSVSHDCVKALRTYTLQCPKIAQFTFPSASYYGEVAVVDIGLPQASLKAHDGKRRLWLKDDFQKTYPRRSVFSHKGSHGKGLIVAGSEDMPGAAVLATRAALRAGIGLLSVSAPNSAKSIIAHHAVEAMYDPFDYRAQTADALPKQLSTYDGVAFGPGIGRAERVEDQLIKLLNNTDGVLVLDADGLFYLNQHLDKLSQRSSPTILTPHPGEMARLVGATIKDVENNRFEMARTFSKTYGVYLILKGPNTLVTAPDGQQWVNSTGNPALANGGTGDVLTGIVLAFALQHKRISAALCNAVYLHGFIADQLSQELSVQSGIVASDLTVALPEALGKLLSATT
ncbi:bifunctional ADP-dependent NAD(P)H-hydrate dehydratase/NAD(P)H-hydrate epimerase [Pullulanibacillus camelliae]|uniref:Bifunctional NAD(P)H-hydrate repair enzyme n=1 Tax=Pullulanibacillus camelliae TaxID=1707096 RepID=A0A8J2VNC0_9BACL|nr:NAD(P)H-hydrate dehydratase [Pullulanibacillus camelliae]GGE34383.1 bifunctional ADP-dependent NAD(P)H-hydrate dehydratase/NAD(P)H-hydrate epimerase [Pullulanibacillus camelliae]